MSGPAQLPGTSRPARWLGGACVAAAIAAYYWLFFLPPRLLGGADPDRYYHLALSRLWAEDGLPRTLPQVEDLGWGGYFPDKEFLFHALSGAAWSLGDAPAVLWLVPILGLLVVLSLYAEASRVLRPLSATLLTLVATAGTAGFLFRLSLLRPHLLAILVFCLLLLAILRERPRLAGLAAAAFALSYHAFFIVGIVAAAAWLLRRQPGLGRTTWAWCLGGLVVGTVLNPYFPSNLSMGVLVLRLALGLASVPPPTPGVELFPPTLAQAFGAYGFLPILLALVAISWLWRRPAASPERSRLLLLFALTLVLTAMGIKNLRAMEYAFPCGLLLAAYAVRVYALPYAVPALLAALLLAQGAMDLRFYRESWQKPEQSALPAYAAVLRQIPAGAHKVFNCEWEAGSYILYERPELRFVDVLEPTLLWDASRERYEARQGLRAGAFDDPRAILRGAFDADYVVCLAGPLTRQMDALPQDFTASPGTERDFVRVFAVRPDERGAQPR